MKRVSFLLVAFFCFSLALSEQLKGAEFRFDFYQTQNASTPISMGFVGEHFNPPSKLSGTNFPNFNRISPQLVMDAFYACLKNRDEAALVRLYAPGERTSTLNISGLTTLEGMSIKATINYGTYTICVVEINANGKNSIGAKALKRIGVDYYLTDVLAEDRTYSFLRKWLAQPDLLSSVSSYRGRSRFENKINLYAFTNENQGPPLRFEYVGTNYTTFTNLLAYKGLTQSNQNMTVPEKALTAVYSAAWQNNLNWYFSLVRTQELDVPFERVMGRSETIRGSISNNMNRVSMVLSNTGPIILKRVIYYDQYAITVMERNSELDWLAFKKEGGRWLLTDELSRGSSVWAFLMDKPHPNSMEYWPKVMP